MYKICDMPVIAKKTEKMNFSLHDLFKISADPFYWVLVSNVVDFAISRYEAEFESTNQIGMHNFVSADKMAEPPGQLSYNGWYW